MPLPGADSIESTPPSASARSRIEVRPSRRERAEALGGSFEICSEPGKGTTISVEVLLERGGAHGSPATPLLRKSRASGGE